MNSRIRATAYGIALGLVALTVSAAFAGEVLKYRNGDLVPGEVVSVDDEAVVFDREVGGKIRVTWDKLYPVSHYELWESTLKVDDAAGRMKLAQWTLEAGLFVQARREAVKAQGLGYAGAVDVPKFLERVDEAEADLTLADIDQLVEAGEPKEALARVRRYLRSAPPGKQADRVRGRVPDLLARIERLGALAREAEEQAVKDRKAARRKDWIDKNLGVAAKNKLSGSLAAVEGFAYLARGNQSRARAQLSKSHSGYKAARKTYRRVQRAVGAGKVADACEIQMLDCDRRDLAVLTRWATLEVDNKAWKKASPLVDAGLRIDPVDRELLELRKKIDENWIRRRMSDITGATGRESGPR